uniref:Dynamin_M domain-containing protein n=1 Tax=Steinernema glaseri TaxID=37863 RepID=A0A1I7Z1M0_9BILA
MELQAYAEVPKEGEDVRRIITKLVNLVVDRMNNDLGNNLSRPGDRIRDDDLNGGAKIARIYSLDYARSIAEISLNEEQLRKEICYIIQNANGIRELEAYAEVPKEGEDVRRIITKLVNLVVDRMNNDLGNNLSRPGDRIRDDDLNGGAKIARIYSLDYARSIAEISLNEEQLRKEICYIIQNANGIRLGNVA